MSRDYNRRQFIDLALNTAKVGGLAVLLQSLPYSQLAKMLGVKPEHLPLVLQDMDLQAEAATLPLNYVSRAGTVPTDADYRNGIADLDVSASTQGTGTTSAVDNTDTSFIKNGGSKNVLVTLASSSGVLNHYMEHNGLSITGTLIPTLGVRIRYHSGTLNNTAQYISNATPMTTNWNGFSSGLNYPASANLAPGWYFLHRHRAEADSSAGTLNWASPIQAISVDINTASGTSLVAYVDQHYLGGYQKPNIVWIFEGGSDTHYNTVFPLWQNYGMQGTIAIPTSVVGTASCLTTAMLDTMYAGGWDIVHMSDTATALTGLTVQQVADRLGTAETAMASWGYTRTPKVIVLPGTAISAHRTDTNAITALTNAGYIAALDKWADGTSGVGPRAHALGIDPDYGFSLNPYRIPAWRTEQPDTLTEYQLHVRHAIASGDTRFLRSSAIGAGGSDLAAADHVSLLQEVGIRHLSSTLNCNPWRKFYSGMQGRMLRG